MSMRVTGLAASGKCNSYFVDFEDDLFVFGCPDVRVVTAHEQLQLLVLVHVREAHAHHVVTPHVPVRLVPVQVETLNQAVAPRVYYTLFVNQTIYPFVDFFRKYLVVPIYV